MHLFFTQEGIFLNFLYVEVSGNLWKLVLCVPVPDLRQRLTCHSGLRRHWTLSECARPARPERPYDFSSIVSLPADTRIVAPRNSVDFFDPCQGVEQSGVSSRLV